MHPRANQVRLLAPFLCALLLHFTALASPPALARNHAGAKDAAVFDEAWRRVRDNFYDPALKGLDWEKIGDTHRKNYLDAGDAKERSAAINAMLAELRASHMIHAIPSEPAYFELVDIFRHGLRDDLSRHFPGGDIEYPGIGIMTRRIDGKIFVSGVLAGLPAEKAGLKIGDEILSADGAPFEPIDSFLEKTGRSVTLSIRREAGGVPLEITVTPETTKPAKAFETAMRDGARIIEANGRRIGYIHVWSYAGERYQNALEEELAEGKLKDADALVWDLRDGWGGARPEFLDIFNARAPNMTMTERDGASEFASYKWRKPVALLVNGGTRSGKEVLTYGFKKYGYGEVIGSATAGALLAGRGFLLSDGSFLMVAVNDVAVDGERLEAKGVEPTIEVPFDLRYAGGRDPQLDKAVEVLSNVPPG